MAFRVISITGTTLWEEAHVLSLLSVNRELESVTDSLLATSPILRTYPVKLSHLRYLVTATRSLCEGNQPASAMSKVGRRLLTTSRLQQRNMGSNLRGQAFIRSVIELQTPKVLITHRATQTYTGNA